MIRLGGVVEFAAEPSRDPEALARAHNEAGYTAAYCPSFVTLEDLAGIRATRDAFAKAGVTIAEVGAWCSLAIPDERERKRNIDYVCQRLALADEVGALCCVDYFGSLEAGTSYAPHPDNLSRVGFDLCVETARKIIDTVKPKRAAFCFEMMQTCFPNSPDSYLNLIKAVARPQFAAHLDPANVIILPQDYVDNGAVIKRCFDLLGPWIISSHAKDLSIGEKLAYHIDEVLPGTGRLDYRTYLTGLDKLGRDVPLMIEHLQTPQEYAQARDNISALANEAGVRLNGA